MAVWKNVVPAANLQFEKKREVLLREASASFNHRGYHGTSLSPTSSLQMFLCVGLYLCLLLCASVSCFLFPDSTLHVCPSVPISLTLSR